MEKILSTALCVIVLMVLGNNVAQAKETTNEKMSMVVTTTDNIPSVSMETYSSTLVTSTPEPTVTPTVTANPKVTDGNYTGTTLTEEDVKGWDWKKSGIIQIGEYLCYFGQNETGKVIWISNYTTTYFGSGIEPDIVITFKQSKKLKYITYKGIKYKTGIGPSHFLTRVTKMKLHAKDKYRSLPQKGDTWVDKNGKKIKITSISYNNVEVPGYGQGIDFYTGLVYETDKSTFKNEDIGGTWNGDDSFLGSPFTVAKDRNGKVFAYFRIKWNCIQSYEQVQAAKVKSPKDGQIAPGCYFTQYNKEYDDWIWIGPVF